MARLTSVRTPKSFQAPFLKAQEYVKRYFEQRSDAPERGTVSISGERYVLVRAASLSVEFFDLVASLYEDKGSEVARRTASNLLFDFAHAIAKADARAFQEKMGLVEPIDWLSAGPFVHFAFSGWAFVHILPESRAVPGDDFRLVYDHPFSFEADAWLRRGRRSDQPVCVMSAGYSSGWCEQSFNLPMVAVEVECLAAGGRRCRFVMAPPTRIAHHLRQRKGGRASRTGLSGAGLAIPEFFQRKRLEDELRSSHELLERRVLMRTRALMRANDRLSHEVAERKRAEEARDEFLSVAAHELKTPVTGLRGFAQLLARQFDKGDIEPARLRRGLLAIDRQSEKLDRLVRQLLDVSRLEGRRLPLERRPTDVVDLVRGAVAVAQLTAPRHVIVVRAPRSLRAEVDPLRLEQVIANLLDNAVKYSPEGGRVDVGVTAGRRRFRVSVCDRGVGVPKELRGRIFERFQRASLDPRLGGMGLGLFVSREIARRHGGVLSAEFPARGGTRMLLDLPRRGPAASRRGQP